VGQLLLAYDGADDDRDILGEGMFVKLREEFPTVNVG
jgi:hypothetical protein